METVRLTIALVLMALVLAGWFYGAAWIRFAPLGLSVVWAVGELIIESRRRARAAAAVDPKVAEHSTK